mgnify:CR=1 FL=1
MYFYKDYPSLVTVGGSAFYNADLVFIKWNRFEDLRNNIILGGSKKNYSKKNKHSNKNRYKSKKLLFIS